MRLRTFGGLWIEAGANPVPSELRPRWLALLALVAAAGPRGISRERVLGILWPDADEERARHALSQTLYSLRRDLEVEPVVGSDLRLDPRVLGSDVGDLLAALAQGDRRRVLDLYQGAFLEGFYLDGATEFERWVEEERARLRGVALGAAEAVAEEASASGDAPGAALAWRRPAQLDPLSARYALAYMKAMVAAGDRAGALAHAREHEAVVRRELEAPPDPEVTALAERLRRSPATPRVQEPALEPEPAARAAPLVSAGSAPAASHRRLVWAVALAAIAVLALLIRSISLRGGADRTPILAVGRLRDAPAKDTSSLSGVLTDMMATNLARIRGMQVVTNSRLFELMQPGEENQRGAFSEAARRAGAAQILEGEVSFAPEGGLQLDLRRIDLRSGVVRQGYRVRALDHFALVDSATAAVARDFALPAPGGAIAQVSTASPLAYRFYEEGLRSFYQYDAAAALRLMQSALQEDSTFAIAAYYLWQSRELVSLGAGFADRARAMRLAPNAPDRERLLIMGTALGSLESPAAIAYAESLSIRFPSDPSGQYLLGATRLTLGDNAGAVAALDRAVALDSSANAISGESCRACESLRTLTWGYLSWDSAGAAERTVRRWIRFQPGRAAPYGMLLEIMARQGRWGPVPGLLAKMDSVEPAQNDWRAASLYNMVRRGAYDSAEAAAIRTLQEPRRDLRESALWYWIIALRNQGRLREATVLVRDDREPDGTRLDPGLIAADPIAKATVEFESGRFASAAAAYSALVASNATNVFPGHRARGMSWMLTLEGTARAAAGDTAAVRLLADSVERVGRESLFGRSGRLHHFLRGLLFAAQGRHAEAVDAYQRAMLSSTDGYTRINYEMARSLLALGRTSEAVTVLQPALRGAIDASNLYLTRTEIHELLGKVFAAAGQRDSAVAHYREVVRSWEKGDPAFQERRRAAMEWLSRNSS